MTINITLMLIIIQCNYVLKLKNKDTKNNKNKKNVLKNDFLQ